MNKIIYFFSIIIVILVVAAIWAYIDLNSKIKFLKEETEYSLMRLDVCVDTIDDYMQFVIDADHRFTGLFYLRRDIRFKLKHLNMGMLTCIDTFELRKVFNDQLKNNEVEILRVVHEMKNDERKAS